MSQPKPVVIGSKYNLLTIIEEVAPYEQPNGRLRRLVKVQCDCGTILDLMLENLYAGYSKSCGCVLKQKTYIHGMSKTSFKEVHTNMKARCDNPKHPSYKHYGGRGITYCPEWKSLLKFKEDMYESYKEGLTLDREDVDGNYNKENCRWVDMTVQGHNKRKMPDCLFKFMGIRMNNGNPDTLVAHIQIKGKQAYIATFHSEDDAAKAYDDASEMLYQNRPNGTEPNEDWIYRTVKDKLTRDGFI